MSNQLRYWQELCEEGPTAALPEQVARAFAHLGSAQRGKPEMAMLQVQHIMGGGVLNPVVEHVGDITHRMSHMAGHGMVLGYEKVQKTYRWLSNKYGFEREMQENITNNARYREVPREQLAQQLKIALRKYAEAHAALPVYNKLQWLARQAAIFIGLEKFQQATQCLKLILNLCPTEEVFREKALEYTLAPDGSVQQFSPKSTQPSTQPAETLAA